MDGIYRYDSHGEADMQSLEVCTIMRFSVVIVKIEIDQGPNIPYHLW